MRVIICGGRDQPPFSLQQTDWLCLLKDHWQISEVITGGAGGIDRYATQWAESMGIDVAIFPANWNKYGKRAGPLRNTRMLRYAMPSRSESMPDVRVVAFPGGPGTANMIQQARRYAVPVVLWSAYQDRMAFENPDRLVLSVMDGNVY